MYKLLLLLSGLLIWNCGVSQGEQTVSLADKITWFGLDFTQAVVIGETATGEEIVNKYFVGWNSVILNEPDKYEFGKFFKKKEVQRDIAYISKQNAQRDPSEVIAYEAQSISEDELVSHVRSYEMQGSGVGLVFVIENFNKLEEQGTMWVTFFDIESKKILLAKHMSAQPRGFGFRNYWLGSVYEVLKTSGQQYKRWIK